MFNELDLLFGFVLFVLLLGAGPALLSVTSEHRDTLRFQNRLFLFSYLVRFTLSISIYQFGLVNVLGDEDGTGWITGISLLQEWKRVGMGLLDLPAALLGAFKGNHRGYQYLLGALFFVTDSPGRMPAATLNCFIGALTVVFTYRIARCLFPDRVAARAGWFTCFFPSLIVWSAQTVKEPVVILLESIALYGCVQLKRSGFSPKHVALCAFAIVLLFPFRFYAAYLAAAVVALTLLLPSLSKGRSAMGSAVMIAGLVLPLALFSGVLAQRETSLEYYDLNSVQRFRSNVSEGTGTGSGVKQSYNLHNPPEFALAVVVGGAHLMLAPFPWQLGGGSLRMVLTLPELVIWWCLFFIGVIPGFWFAVRRRFSDIQPLLLFTLGLGLLYSMMFGNIGLVYRQRAQLLPWLFIFASVGLELRKRSKAEPRRSGHSNKVLVEAPR